MKKEKVITAIIIAFLVFYFVMQISESYAYSKNFYKRNDALKESMQWINNNAEPNSKILVGDPIVYQYFTNNALIGYSQAFAWMQQFAQETQINDKKATLSAFLAGNNIDYFIAYDSTMRWFYKDFTEDFAIKMNSLEYEFQSVKVKLEPIKKFEKYDAEVILYKVNTIKK